MPFKKHQTDTKLFELMRLFAPDEWEAFGKMIETKCFSIPAKAKELYRILGPHAGPKGKPIEEGFFKANAGLFFADASNEKSQQWNTLFFQLSKALEDYLAMLQTRNSPLAHARLLVEAYRDRGKLDSFEPLLDKSLRNRFTQDQRESIDLYDQLWFLHENVYNPISKDDMSTRTEKVSQLIVQLEYAYWLNRIRYEIELFTNNFQGNHKDHIPLSTAPLQDILHIFPDHYKVKVLLFERAVSAMKSLEKASEHFKHKEFAAAQSILEDKFFVESFLLFIDAIADPKVALSKAERVSFMTWSFNIIAMSVKYSFSYYRGYKLHEVLNKAQESDILWSYGNPESVISFFINALFGTLDEPQAEVFFKTKDLHKPHIPEKLWKEHLAIFEVFEKYREGDYEETISIIHKKNKGDTLPNIRKKDILRVRSLYHLWLTHPEAHIENLDKELDLVRRKYNKGVYSVEAANFVENIQKLIAHRNQRLPADNPITFFQSPTFSPIWLANRLKDLSGGTNESGNID